MSLRTQRVACLSDRANPERFEELGFPRLSEAMVNIRFTLAAAERAGVLTAGTRDVLERMGKALSYPDRSCAEILRRAAALGIPGPTIEAFRAWLGRGRVDKKRSDAIAMLRCMRTQADSEPLVPGPSFELSDTIFWRQVVRHVTIGRPHCDHPRLGAAGD